MTILLFQGAIVAAIDNNMTTSVSPTTTASATTLPPATSTTLATTTKSTTAVPPATSSIEPPTTPRPIIDRWLVSYKDSPNDYCIIMQANIVVSIKTEGQQVGITSYFI